LNQPSWPALVSSAEPEALQHHGQRGFFYFNYEGLRHRQKFAAGPVQNILREVYWKQLEAGPARRRRRSGYDGATAGAIAR